MIKKNLFLLFIVFNLLVCKAQEEVVRQVTYANFDSLCFHFYELTAIEFDVSQKFGCEFLITQLLNKTEYFSKDSLDYWWDIYYPEDSLVYLWNVFNTDSSIYFVFNEENPDIFLYEPGNYNIEFIVSNIYGCADTLTKFNVISIDKMPQVDFSFTPENALFAEYFGEVEFTNLTDPELLNDTAVVWLWDFGDHVVNGVTPSPVHLFSVWGDYHTTFHLKTKNGCKVALTKTVVIEGELFFPDTLKLYSQTTPSIFAVSNLNTHIPQDNPDQFRTNHLFVYKENGEIVYEQKNYDTYKKNNVIVEGTYSLSVMDLDEGMYYYSFYYKGKSKMVHYSGDVWVDYVD